MQQNDPILERLAALRDALADQSTFPEDSFAWGAACLAHYLEQGGKMRMEQAFGMVEHKTTAGERMAAEVQRLKWNEPALSWRDICARLAETDLDTDERNLRRYWRDNEDRVKAAVVGEELARRLDERERNKE